MYSSAFYGNGFVSTEFVFCEVDIGTHAARSVWWREYDGFVWALVLGKLHVYSERVDEEEVESWR